MSDLISRGRARHEFSHYFRDNEKIREQCDSLLCMLPAVDAVPVVRCKDCKNTMLLNLFSISDNSVEERVLHCVTGLGRVQPDDFCSWGERRDDGNNE